MPVTCKVCGKIYSSQSCLNRHRKSAHKMPEKEIVSYDFDTFNAKCFSCSSSFKYISDLRQHLADYHQLNVEKEEKSFPSFEDFQIWLEQSSKNENVEYVLTRGAKLLKMTNGDTKAKVSYYNCNRSIRKCGKTVEDRNRKRALKTQGSCKLDFSCISQIILTQSEDDTCHIKYYRTHNHEKKVQHLHISKADRKSIANKLMTGVPLSKILDQQRENITENGIQRINLLTRKDLNNIRASYGIDVVDDKKRSDKDVISVDLGVDSDDSVVISNDGKRSDNDAVSVHLWVQEQMGSDDSVVIFYKQQGVENEEENLSKDDFCLILMNRSQKYMLQVFGSNIIAIDSTHGLNSYNFQLTTLMVIDEYGEGFPAACMFSNRQDTYINTIFFAKLRDVLKCKIAPKTFMSNTTEIFYNAWLQVMDVPSKRLYCAWHIDHAWQNNLIKISNLEKRKQAYQTLKYLQNLTDINIFQDQLQTTISLFFRDTDTLEFARYFKNNFGENYEYWAACFRQGCGINANTHLKSMHKTIKYFHLDGQTVKRLDKGLHAVLEHIRNKVVERIIKRTKGKITTYSRKIMAQHRVALTTDFDVDQKSDMEFSISEENEGFSFHNVTKSLKFPCCKLLCNICNICVHSFQCTCPDYFIHNTICKHIHYVAINFEKLPLDCKGIKAKAEDIAFHMNTVVSLNKDVKSNTLKEKINNLLNDMQIKLDKHIEEHKLQEFYKNLKKASLILENSMTVTYTRR